MTAVAPRLGPIPVAQWADGTREAIIEQMPRSAKFLTGAPDAPPLPNILGLFGHHPHVTAPWIGFSNSLLDGGALRPYDRELLILRVAWRVRSAYEWDQHVRMGQDAGLSPEQVAAVAGTPDADLWTPQERALLRAADEMIDGHQVTSETWAALARAFDQPQLLEVLFVVGSYLCLALVLNSVGLPADGDNTLAASTVEED